MRRLVVIVAIVGCGRIGFDPTAGRGGGDDAALVLGDARSDNGPTGLVCDEVRTFEAIANGPVALGSLHRFAVTSAGLVVAWATSGIGAEVHLALVTKVGGHLAFVERPTPVDANVNDFLDVTIAASGDDVLVTTTIQSAATAYHPIDRALSDRGSTQPAQIEMYGGAGLTARFEAPGFVAAGRVGVGLGVEVLGLDGSHVSTDSVNTSPAIEVAIGTSLDGNGYDVLASVMGFPNYDCAHAYVYAGNFPAGVLYDLDTLADDCVSPHVASATPVMDAFVLSTPASTAIATIALPVMSVSPTTEHAIRTRAAISATDTWLGYLAEPGLRAAHLSGGSVTTIKTFPAEPSELELFVWDSEVFAFHDTPAGLPAIARLCP